MQEIEKAIIQLQSDVSHITTAISKLEDVIEKFISISSRCDNLEEKYKDMSSKQHKFNNRLMLLENMWIYAKWWLWVIFWIISFISAVILIIITKYV